MNKSNFFVIIAAVCLLLAWSGVYFFLLQKSSIEPTNNITSEAQEPGKSPPIDPDVSMLDWQEATSSAAWSARDAHATVIFKNKLWLMGGLNGNAVTKGTRVEYWKAPHNNDVWTSENGTNWTLVATASAWAPRRSLSVVEFKDTLWMIGGWSPVDGYHTNIFTTDDGIHWTVATTSAKWSDREGQIVQVFDDKLWLFGGVNYDKHAVFNDVWSSDDGRTWTEVASSSPWSGRYDHDVAVYKGKMWLMGGMHLDGQGEKDVWSTVNGRDWTLETADAPWGPRHGLATLEYKGKMWVIGGWDILKGEGARSVWYSEDGALWQKTLRDTPWIGREDHTALVFNDKIWVMGGMNTGFRWTNDIWHSTLDAIPAEAGVQNDKE